MTSFVFGSDWSSSERFVVQSSGNTIDTIDVSQIENLNPITFSQLIEKERKAFLDMSIDYEKQHGIKPIKSFSHDLFDVFVIEKLADEKKAVVYPVI